MHGKIAKEQRKGILKEIYSELGNQRPLEIHIADCKDFEWYKKFEMKGV
ncbi:MAG: hypothetical protein QFX37_08705 [Archaeoglobales archaeon]|nr:hypothetical protein [Archaeoglobales archaeon]